MPQGALEGRVAVVTGAGQGIGQAIAVRYAREGAKVAVVDLDLDRAKQVVKEIEGEAGTALAVQCDVSNRISVEAAAVAIANELGVISILVNNAGVSRPAMLWKMTEHQWETVIGTHMNGSFYWLQAVTPGMRQARRGSIIFTTSAAGIQGTIGQINYATAKSGILAMMRSAALELASSGITVNAIAPAAATPMTETIRTDERFKDKYLDTIPLGRWAEPEEIAGSYVFFASADAAYITGQTLSVDGGRVMMR